MIPNRGTSKRLNWTVTTKIGASASNAPSAYVSRLKLYANSFGIGIPRLIDITPYSSRLLVINTASPPSTAPMLATTEIWPSERSGPDTPKVRSMSAPTASPADSDAVLNTTITIGLRCTRSAMSVATAMVTMAAVGLPSRTSANAKADPGVTSLPAPKRSHAPGRTSPMKSNAPKRRHAHQSTPVGGSRISMVTTRPHRKAATIATVPT